MKLNDVQEAIMIKGICILLLFMAFSLLVSSSSHGRIFKLRRLSVSMSTSSKLDFISQHKFSVAPMMEYTDTHQRHLMRLLSTESVLYTEMVYLSLSLSLYIYIYIYIQIDRQIDRQLDRYIILMLIIFLYRSLSRNLFFLLGSCQFPCQNR